MKLSTNDLDKSLIDKITQLDEMRLNYTKDDGNIVMYDGNSFYTGKMPEVKVKLPYFSTEELYNFKQNLFSNNELYTSSYTNNFQNEVRNNSAFKNIMKSMSYSFISKLDSTALFFKMYGSYYYAFTSSGKLYKISKTQLNEQTVFDIIAILKTNFACQNLFARKILDIIPYEDGFLISVLDNGVYYININTGIYELKLNITSINKLYRLNSTKILALSNTEKKSVIIFDAVSGKKIDSFDTLSNFNQLPDSAVITEKGFYVLGKYIGNSAPINMIHYWQLDAGEISYENFNNIETIIMMLTQIVVWILGALSKKNENIKNDMIIFQNGIIGLISCALYYIVSKDFSVAIATSGLTADVLYNLVHSSYKLIKRK